MRKALSEFVGELKDTEGNTQLLRISVDETQRTGCVQIAARRVSFTEVEKFLSVDASNTELRGRIDLLLVDFGLYVKVARAPGSQMKVVVVTSGFAEQDTFTLPPDDCPRLAEWIRVLTVPESPR